jgi:hypothetical protein
MNQSKQTKRPNPTFMEVFPASYTDNVTIDRSIIIRGSKMGVASRGAGRTSGGKREKAKKESESTGETITKGKKSTAQRTKNKNKKIKGKKTMQKNAKKKTHHRLLPATHILILQRKHINKQRPNDNNRRREQHPVEEPLRYNRRVLLAWWAAHNGRIDRIHSERLTGRACGEGKRVR